MTPAPPPAPIPPPAAPGERDFREGWEALRAGDAARAATAFAAARLTAGPGLAEDAHFWEGIALARAGRSGPATRVLSDFLKAYPSSARTGEAATRLGWLLFDAGDLAGADPLFRRGLTDRSPRIRKNAQHGLEAIRRRKE